MDAKETKVEGDKAKKKEHKNNGGDKHSKSRSSWEVLKKFDNYTPLKENINHILEEIKSNEELNWPEKMKADPDKRNKAKYCEFHKDHGHMTKNCIALQNEIETLIR